jgi:hypothetical protein
VTAFIAFHLRQYLTNSFDKKGSKMYSFDKKGSKMYSFDKKGSKMYSFDKKREQDVQL